MPEAIFRITAVGGDEVARVLAKVTAASVRSQTQIGAQSERSSRDTARYADSHVKSWERAERERTRAALRESAERKRADDRVQKQVERAQREMARLVAGQSRQRVKEAERETREIERLAKAQLAARASAEKQATREAEREEENRIRNLIRVRAKGARDGERAARRAVQAERESDRRNDARTAAYGRAGESRGRAAYDVASSFASTMHGQIQDVRERRAVSERIFGQALNQVGGNRNDVQAGMRQVTQFAATNRMDSSEIVNAIASAQGQFSVLEGSGSLEDKIQEQLNTALLARNTGNNPMEMLRLSGMLQYNGMNAPDRRRMMLYAAGAAQHGAVELGNLTKEGLSAITRRMSTAVAGLGPNATAEQRTAAERDAFRQSVSELEVAKGFGGDTKKTGNALASLSTSLTGTRVQNQMLTNIRRSVDLSDQQKRSLESELFQKDDHGRSSLRSTNALHVAQSFARVAGDNPALMNNVFAGSGHGNAMSLQKNWRDIMGVMVSADAGGRTGAQRIKSLMDEGSTSLSEADVRRGGETFGNDALAKLQGDQETHDNALSDNTSALVNASNTFASWVKQNPMPAAVGAVAAEKILPRIAGAGGRALGQTLAPRAGILGRLGGVISRGASAGVGLLSDLLHPSNQSMSGRTEHIDEAAAIRAYHAAGGGAAGVRAGNTASTAGGKSVEEVLRKAVEEGAAAGVRRGLSESRVEVSPHAAAHAATQASVARR